MDHLGPELLANRPDRDPLAELRLNIEDALKEYGELDVLVELLQNSLDSIDELRYQKICHSVSMDHASMEVIEKWNAAVNNAIYNDYIQYSGLSTTIEKAALYRRWSDEQARRDSWWRHLAEQFDADADVLKEAAEGVKGRLAVTIRIGPPVIIEVEDNGIGIDDIPAAFMHKYSTKRSGRDRSRRLGVRGSHGWGLTAVLGYSQAVDVASRVSDGEVKAYRFARYREYVLNPEVTPENYSLSIDEGEADYLSERIRRAGGPRGGTHIRVELADRSTDNHLGHAIENPSFGKFANLLRMYTPIGQLNDYLLHPAYHNCRKLDMDIVLKVISNGEEVSDVLNYDTQRFFDHSTRPAHYDYHAYINASSPRGVSVHTIHRYRSGDEFYLSAADIQFTDLVHEYERSLCDEHSLPGVINELGEAVYEIPRGFQLVLSGGMRSEYCARLPRSATAAYRGYVLSETAKPTLGRKHVIDQRTSIAKAAQAHETCYNELRKLLRPVAEPPPTTPAAARWRRDFHQSVINQLSENAPESEDLHVWSSTASREALVMLLFGELLGRGKFGNIRVLRAHLQDVYDFTFLQRADVGDLPDTVVRQRLTEGGYSRQDGARFVRYGIGEFKCNGEDILDDFDDRVHRKQPDTPDVLVCWDFDSDRVQDASWSVIDDCEREFIGQTHAWIPRVGEVRRERPLPVISLRIYIQQLVDEGALERAPEMWPEQLPELYY